MVGRINRKKGKKVSKVKKLPKNAPEGALFDVEVPMKNGNKRLQRFRSTGKTFFQLVKNPKERHGLKK